MVNLNDKLLWALTPDARIAVDRLVDNGIDKDLALSILEGLCGEEKIYSLDSEGDNE